MPDIRVRGFAGGIDSPNPFWLASAPPTNCGEQIMRAFDAGWGGAVWKTIGEPVTNVSSRYSATDWNGLRIMGFNNIELISDRSVEDNLREMAEVKKRYPYHAVIASLMVASNREAWHDIVARAEDAGADGLELNFGCPHGMSERGMGSAVGQVPEYTEMITAWVKEKARTPVLVKLTPNITDIRTVARAARRGGADGLSAINTINSITGIDLDTLVPRPDVDGKSSHGGYCGPAVKPIALNMVQQVMADPQSLLPLSGIGGIETWRDAAEFMLLGCGTVQVCTAVMHYGYRIVEDMAEGLESWMRTKGFNRVDDFRGLSLDRVADWKHLNLNYKIVARIDEQKCIGCDLCHIACWDGAHQCIHLDRVTGPVNGHVELHATPAQNEARTRSSITVTPVTRKERAEASSPRGPYMTPIERIPRVDETECVGCNLCALVCPVDQCITMVRVDSGIPAETWDERTRGADCTPQPQRS
jgi:dihydropyrimidine dehydrogenase (NAD+) subunit PreA